MTYTPDDRRYDSQPYRRSGRSGLLLPAVSLGLWQNFGADRDPDLCTSVLTRAFDLGVTHFDLANNYGPPHGAAEINFGRIFERNFRPFRDELIVSTKAGYEMWPGPYGNFGSRKSMTASLDQSLARMGLDYVDIFYSHRPDPDAPLEETMGALSSAVQRGKALYVGISNYGPEQTAQAQQILADNRTPLLIHQMRYSLLERTAESKLFPLLSSAGVGSIAFSPLAQGLLTDRYLHGIPSDSRAASESPFLSPAAVTPAVLNAVKALSEIARQRGQTLAQMAISWVLRPAGATSALIGASSVTQLEANLRATQSSPFTDDELRAIDAALN